MGISRAVHVFGDSHSESFFHQIPYCIVHWLGPITMHRIGRDGIHFFDMRRYGVKKNDIVVLVFGEIDVRCHIQKQSEIQNQSVDFVIEELCKAYVATILANQEKLNGIIIVLYEILPPSDIGTEEEILTFYGTLADRVTITQKINAKLKELCEANNFQLVDLNTPFTLNDGSLNHAYSDGHVHVRPEFGVPVVQPILETSIVNALPDFNFSHLNTRLYGLKKKLIKAWCRLGGVYAQTRPKGRNVIPLDS